MPTTTLLALIELFNQAIGDSLEFDTTTNITTNKSVISTTLNQFDGGEDGYGDDWWLYITEGNNAGVERKCGSTTYATSSGTLYVYGANLSSESGAVTCRLGMFRRTNKKQAIIQAIAELYPNLFLPIDDMTLITGNSLWDSSFEWWTSNSALKFMQTSNAAVSKETTTIRGQLGTTAMKVTASAPGGYAYLDSIRCPWLLDLMGKTISGYVWAYPETAGDGSIELYTKQADGTAQTFTSSTSNPASMWSKLEKENNSFNDDLALVEIRFKVATNGDYVIFDDALVSGYDRKRFLLPENLHYGTVNQAYVQTHGYSEEMAYDLQPRYWDRRAFQIEEDGTYKYLSLDTLFSGKRRIRLVGSKPLEDLSADTDTITLDNNRRRNLIIARAAQILYKREQGAVSSEDTSRYDIEIRRWEREEARLKPSLGMVQPSSTIWTGGW